MLILKKDLKINDVEILNSNKILGKGAFSIVLKVRNKKSNELFALK